MAIRAPDGANKNINICSLYHLIWVSELELPLLSGPRYAVLRGLPGKKDILVFRTFKTSQTFSDKSSSKNCQS